MKIGAISYLWAEEFGAEHCGILPRLKEAGLDGLEIGILAPAAFPAKAIRRELEKTGLECTTCAVIPPGTSLISEDAEQRRKARAHIEECIKLATDAGSQILAGPDRKSTRLNSSHPSISYAVFCLKKKNSSRH